MRYRLREVRVAVSPLVNNLWPGDAEALGNLCGADQVIHVDSPSHISDATS